MSMHAHGVRPGLGRVRLVESTKPIEGAYRSLSQGFPEGFGAGLLSAWFVEAGGDPNVGLPAVRDRFEPLEIPAPLEDETAGGKDADESKRVYAFERECFENPGGGSRGSSLERRPNDVAAADALSRDTGRH